MARATSSKRTQDAAAERSYARWATTINISLGSIAGPHDGSTITEQALASLAADNVHIVLAAGNTAGKRVHAGRTVAREASGRFDVMTRLLRRAD